MFLRIVKNSKGVEYLRIVENYRENGKTKQKTIANLGRVDKISEAEAENIIKKMINIFGLKNYLATNEIEEEPDKKNYGIKAVVNKIFERYEMKRFFKKLDREIEYNAEEMLKIMVMNRILEPKSKLSIFNNLEYLGYKAIERREGKDLDEDEVMLHWLYRTLDILAENKEKIEKHMYDQRISLFNTTVDLVFYDVTTLAFETQKTNEILQMGYSKDKKFNESQIVLGMSIDQDRMPVSFDIYPGNTFEGHTLKDSIQKMKKDYQLGKVIVVADRGMMNKENIKTVEESGYEYIIGKSIKQIKKINIFEGEFTEIAKGIKYREIEYENKRLLIIYSEERAKKDKKDRMRLIEKAEKMLDEGNIEVKSKRGAKKYLKEQKKQEYVLDKEKIEKDAKYDGYYGIITNTKLTPQKILEQYHTLWKVEETFRTLKNYLETRPVYHWAEKRIKGHIVMSFISYIIQRTLEIELEKNNIEYSHQKIRDALKSMEYIEFKTANQRLIARTKINKLGQNILKVLNIPLPKIITPYEEFKEKYKI